MKQLVNGIPGLVLSLFVFIAVSLAIGGTAYQIFTPEGAIFQWVAKLWQINPLLPLLLGLAFWVIKHWLESTERSAQFADMTVYLAVLVGMYFGLNMLAMG